ncbi:MAG: DsbC family protein [Wenzhouxiangella sp.]|nr:MAG: DsbC family protein [Wenzhouxiangella sp.]
MRSFYFGAGFVTLFGWAAVAQAVDTGAIEARLSGLVPDMDQVSISETPIDGLMQVQVGSEVLYMTSDGRYLVQGRVIDMETQTDLTDAAQSGMRREQLAKLDSSDFVSFGNADSEFEVLVFTDPDCGYCRRLHEQIADYEAAGIKIHYLAFPRAGAGSATHTKMVSVWCADDRQGAMDIAKAGGNPPRATCDNPVMDQYRMGQALGVTGTPSIMTFNGDIIPGYVPADRLRERLDRLAASNGQ